MLSILQITEASKMVIEITCEPTGHAVRYSELIPTQGNLKELSTENYNKLKDSIIENGFMIPFFVWEKDDQHFLVDGHQRHRVIESMQLEGFKFPDELPIVKIHAVSLHDAKKKLLLITSQYGEMKGEGLYQFICDNEIDVKFLDSTNYDAIDKDLFNDEFLKDKLDDEPSSGDGTKGDEVPEDVKVFVEEGDVWELGNHRIMCGDSTDMDNVAKLMNGEKADMVFTSPPYMDMRSYEGNKDLSVEKMTKVLEIDVNVFCINLGIKINNREVIRYWDDYINAAYANGYKLTAWNVWDKGMNVSVGQMRDDFIVSHEWIFVFTKNEKLITIPVIANINAGMKPHDVGGGGKVRNKDGEYGKVAGNKAIRDKREMSSILNVTPDVGVKINHPAKYPVELPATYIEAIGKDNVVDPFLGSGTTLIACEEKNKQCFGMELETEYCSLIIERFKNYVESDEDIYLIKDDGEKIPYQLVLQNRI